MYAKILVPLDGSALAERAVGHAIEVAKGTGAVVHLIQAVRSPIARAPEAGQTEEDRVILEEAAAAGTYLKAIAEKVKAEGIGVRVAVIEAPADTAILSYAHTEDVDVIVMSTHGRSGVGRVLMGSVAEKVMLTTKRPVMLVKPEKSYVPRIDEADVFSSTGIH